MPITHATPATPGGISAAQWDEDHVGGGGTQDLEAVLTEGNTIADGQSIVGADSGAATAGVSVILVGGSGDSGNSDPASVEVQGGRGNGDHGVVLVAGMVSLAGGLSVDGVDGAAGLPGESITLMAGGGNAYFDSRATLSVLGGTAAGAAQGAAIYGGDGAAGQTGGAVQISSGYGDDYADTNATLYLNPGDGAGTAGSITTTGNIILGGELHTGENTIVMPMGIIDGTTATGEVRVVGNGNVRLHGHDTGTAFGADILANFASGGVGGPAEIYGGDSAASNPGGPALISGGYGDDGDANPASVTAGGGAANGSGGSVSAVGGDAETGSNHAGGDITLTPGAGDGAGRDGLIIPALPTADPSVTNALYSNSGIVQVSGSDHLAASDPHTGYVLESALTTVATDTIWDAAGDLALGSGANTAAKLTIGAAGGAVSRVNGAVAWNSGTSFPTAATGDRYWRTDLGMEAYYDGTQWLCTCPHLQWIGSVDNIVATTTATGSRQVLWAPTYDVWVVNARMWSVVITTNDGSKYWSVTVDKVDTAGTLATVATVTTAADTPGVQTQHVTSVGALLGTTNVRLQATFTKVSTPDACYGGIALEYRLVLT